MSDAKTDPRLDIVRQNLRLAIALRGTTAADASRDAGLSVNLLGAFLRGQSSTSYANLLKICDVLDLPIGILHKSGAITPARLELQRALENLNEDQLGQAIAEIDRGS